jgi:hypothetical protein
MALLVKATIEPIVALLAAELATSRQAAQHQAEQALTLSE